MRVVLGLLLTILSLQSFQWQTLAATVSGFEQIDIEGRTKFEDDLREFVEYLRLYMKCGYEPAGIPPLAPYQLEHADLQLKAGTWELNGNLDDFTINGLDGFDVTKLKWSNTLAKLTFDLNFPEISAKGLYKMDLFKNLYDTTVRIFGDGLFQLDLQNLRFYGSLHLGITTSGGVRVWNFKANMELGSVRSSTTGIMNNALYTKLFNSWIEELIHLTFNESPDEVSNALSTLAVPRMNKALANVSPVAVLALILGLANDVIPTEVIC